MTLLDDSITFAGLKITALTSRHFSGRSGKDRNRTLWVAFLIEGGGKKIFFGADGGYGKHFREIGRKHGPFDLVCLEIDA
ncbi:MAG: MBL fold metallo-hydrolase [Victivallales bacterium]